MKHEKEFKREDKSTVKVTVTLSVPYSGADFMYWVNVRKRHYRTRKWLDSSKAATPDEIQSVKNELWQKIKPAK